MHFCLEEVTQKFLDSRTFLTSRGLRRHADVTSSYRKYTDANYGVACSQTQVELGSDKGVPEEPHKPAVYIFESVKDVEQLIHPESGTHSFLLSSFLRSARAAAHPWNLEGFIVRRYREAIDNILRPHVRVILVIVLGGKFLLGDNIDYFVVLGTNRCQWGSKHRVC